jgi:hypothetical protein
MQTRPPGMQYKFVKPKFRNNSRDERPSSYVMDSVEGAGIARHLFPPPHPTPAITRCPQCPFYFIASSVHLGNCTQYARLVETFREPRKAQTSCEFHH